jgi:hypothetical protein
VVGEGGVNTVGTGELNVGVVLKMGVALKTGVVLKMGVVTSSVLKSTGTVNGVGAQPTIVMPGTSTRSPYPQYGDAGFVLYVHQSPPGINK